MKRALFYSAFAVFGAGLAVLGFFIGWGSVGVTAGTRPDETADISIDPTVYTTFAPFEPSRTAAPQDPTETPVSTFSPVPGEDEFLVLVNLNNPMYSEPQVVNISELLTASNVVCDSRRHANETAIRALNEMFLAASEAEGCLTFTVASAFRSLKEQDIIWSSKLSEDPDYGKNGEPLKVMPPACSEHITGLAFDILSPAHPHSDEGFDRTPEGIWLSENAWRFGFILRYPEDKQDITGVVCEPWHFRYVGKDAAKYIYEHGLCLEEYLDGLPNP